MTIEKRTQIISWMVALVVLLAFMAFVLGFVFAHGLCCGDDADLAVKAKQLAAGDFRSIYVGFDPHLGVILPIALLIKLVGATYWVPGVAMVIVNVVLLVAMGLLLRNYHTDFGYAIAVVSFFYLNYALMTRHFEQWFAALGEVPTGLLIITAVLIYYYRDSSWNQIAAGSLLLFAILTKLTAIIALLAFIMALLIQAFLEYFHGERADSIVKLKKAGLLSLGILIPFLLFEIVHISAVGVKGNINRLVNTFEKGLAYLRQYQGNHLIVEYLNKTEIFEERFGIPFLIFTLMIFVAGMLVARNKRLKQIYFALLSIIVLYSSWWFYFSIGWGRHYIVPLLLGIFVLVLPFISIERKKYRYIYLLGILLWSTFTWQSFAYPIRKLEGNFFRPTESTQTLLAIPALLSEMEEGTPVITKRHGTFEAIQYITDQRLNFVIFDSLAQYEQPVWVAIRTEWVAVNEDFLQYANRKSFKYFYSRCGGLEEGGGYLIGLCR